MDGNPEVGNPEVADLEVGILVDGFRVGVGQADSRRQVARLHPVDQVGHQCSDARPRQAVDRGAGRRPVAHPLRAASVAALRWVGSEGNYQPPRRRLPPRDLHRSSVVRQ